MSNEIKIPDIGGATDVDVIEVMVKPGDEINVDDSLITLETDKASMEIPSPVAGIVKEVLVKVGDKVAEGITILTVEASSQAIEETPSPVQSGDEHLQQAVESPKEPLTSAATQETIKQVVIPDIGDAKDVDVIEVMVKAGDEVSQEQALLTLEGDKATMDIPSPFAGTVESVSIAVGDKVSQGSPVLSTKVMHEGQVEAKAPIEENHEPVKQEKAKPAQVDTPAKSQTTVSDNREAYAGPAVRRFARELGVDLNKVKGSGRKGRITKEDVQRFVKESLARPASQEGFSLPKAPSIDFAKFGEVELKALNKIKRVTAANMHRSWLTVPHVTQFDEADVTELEAFRKANKAQAEKEGYKLTVLAFVVKAVVKALQRFPHFNASLDEGGDNLIVKHYYNIGIAVDTPNGLVVPVIKECDKKSVADIAKDMAHLSLKAREKGLMPADMSGGCFTISSLGGIGGTAFTPIVNHPEVAILGLSRNQMKPVYSDGQFVPRMMLPLSLSYDHRVIDGAEAARFITFLNQCLTDIRTLLL